MQILFIAPRFHTNQYQTVKTLQDAGHNVNFHVASIGSTEDHSLLVPDKFDQCKLSIMFEKVFGVGGVTKPNYFPNPYKYWMAFKRVKADIVVIRDPYRIFSLLVAFYCLISHSRIVFYTQEELYRQRTKKTIIKQKLTIRLFKAAWMIPIIGVENDINSKLPHMYFVPIPIPIKENISVRNIAHDEQIKILMVGKYHQERKKHLLFINAINHLKNKYQFKVTIVGECTREVQMKKYECIQASISDLGLHQIIELKKNIPFSEMEALYKAHDIFVLPSVNEPHGVSVCEALGYGLPTICTDTCGARFNILNGENGYIIKSNSLEDLIQALEKLLSNKAIVNKMSSNGLVYFRKNLSGDAFYNCFNLMITDRFNISLKSA